MILRVLAVLSIVLLNVIEIESTDHHQFPHNFKFGASTSAAQVEGAWNVDGKGESFVDFFMHSAINVSTGDVAANSYHLWEKDVQIAKELGLNLYRFSISWSRILPTGYTDKINMKGAEYYNKLINTLIAAGIEPVVTMIHFDLPNRLQQLGGWTNSNIVNWFLDYSKVLFNLYADRVKYWLTINEPFIFCQLYTPQGPMHEAEPLCSKNVMLAHGTVYRYYEMVYKEKYKGLMSISNVFIWSDAASPRNKKEKKVAELSLQYNNGRFFHPIYSKEGGWPPLFEKFMNSLNLAEGKNSTALPAFTDDEKKLIQGSSDFLAVNYYSGFRVKLTTPDNSKVDRTFKLPGMSYEHDYFSEGAYNTSWLFYNLYPPGLRKSVSWLTKEYGNWNILISENGYGGLDRGLNDCTRIRAIKDNLKQVLVSMHEDKINYLGYIYWSMIDSFEFNFGYQIKFGLWDVDFDDPERPRTARDSALYYTCVIQNKQLETCEHLITKTKSLS